MADRTWDSDGTAHWVSSDLLVSYALIKDRPIIKDLSVVAGVRWDYQTMSFDDPRNALNVLSSPADTVDFRMQTLAPVAGLSLTVGGLKSGIWLGDAHLRVLAGPIVWGNEDYRETFGVVTYHQAQGRPEPRLCREGLRGHHAALRQDHPDDGRVAGVLRPAHQDQRGRGGGWIVRRADHSVRFQG